MFKLQRPTASQKNGVVLCTQLFGENDVDFYQKAGWKGHNGIDLYTLRYQDGNAPVFAAHDGYVVSDKTKMKQSSGIYVKLMSDEVEIDGRLCKVETTYFHMKEARVSVTDDPQVKREIYWARKGQLFVRAGQLIGIANNSGEWTTGPHLHFGMRIFWKVGNNYLPNTLNGFDGACDPMRFLIDNVVYQLGGGLWGIGGSFFFNGKQVSRAEAKKHMVPPPWF